MPIDDGEARRRIREDRKSTLAVDAGAGTGKTTELLSRLTGLLLEDGVPLSRVVAITFTEKSAAELSVRLRGSLEKAWVERPEKRALLRTLMRDLERTNLSTIHSFCMRILKEFPFEAGLDPQFEVMDDVQAEVEGARRWEEWLGRALQDEAPELVAALRCGVTFAQVEGLKDFLVSNRTLLSGDVTVPPAPDAAAVKRTFGSAQAGLRRILASGRDDDERLTKAARQEMTILADLAASEDRDVPFVLMRGSILGYKNLGSKDTWGEDLPALRAVVEGPRAAWKAFREAYGAHVLRSLERWLGGFVGDPDPGDPVPALLSFDDLLLRTRDLLRDNAAVRRRLSERFDHVFVDEFQDTDPLQAEIVMLLCSVEGETGPVLAPGRLFVVGDPKQSIYRFRRADLGQYLRIREEVRRAPEGRVEELATNFRTVPGVLEWVNGRFGTLLEGQEIPFAPLRASREPGPQGAVTPVTGLKIAPPETDAPVVPEKEAEARAVASHLKRLFAESPLVYDKDRGAWVPLEPHHVAVLFRNLSGYEEAYEEAFRRLEVPFAVVGGKKFYRRPEIAALSTLLSCVSAPAEEALCVAALRSFLFGFSDQELFLLRAGGRGFRFLEPFTPSTPLEERLKKAFGLLAGLRLRTASLGLPEAIREVFRATDLLVVTASQPHGAQRVANLLKVRDLAAGLEDAENATLRGFAAWLRERQVSESDEEQAPSSEESEGAVRWMTIHQAKGLEFPVVVIAGFEAHGEASRIVDRRTGRTEIGVTQSKLATQGLEALKEAEKEARSREDARLLYVACTRARDALIVPFRPPLKETHLLARLCEGWAKDAAAAPCDQDAPTGGRVMFEVPPPFPEESSDLEAHAVRLDEADPGSKAVQDADARLEEEGRAWRERIGRLRAGPLTAKAHDAAEATVSDDRRAEGDGTGMRFGSLVHRLMEVALSGDAGRLKAGAEVWGAELSLGKKRVREASDLTLRAMDHGIVRRARASGRVHCEVAAALAEPEGPVLEGVMDLAFLEDGAWVVVDYKTDRDPERFLEKYEAQLKAYARLLKTSTGMPVKEACLFFLRSGEVRKVPL